jgi:cytochrome c oxidase cbb3-type subunit II
VSFHTSPRLLAIVPTAVFVGLTAIIAIVPSAELNAKYTAQPEDKTMPEDVQHGRRIYLSQGCVSCHTQQVRSDNRLAKDENGRYPVLGQDARYGRPSRPEDYVQEEPPLLGSQRSGPDLQNVGDRLPSADWHFTHLYDPRSVVPDSFMPRYSWLFRGRADHQAGDRRVLMPATLKARAESDPAKRADLQIWATPDAVDLVAYLLWLKASNRTP